MVGYLTALSHAFAIAVNIWELLEHSPTTRIRKSSEPRGSVRFLDKGELERLLKACQELDNPLLYPVVVQAITKGMRQAEIAEVLGHKTLAMVKRYAHMSDAHTVGVVKRISEKIFG